MRIRKRQPLLLLESPRPTLPHLAMNIPVGNPEMEHVVGQNSCTCCSRQRQLQYWELAAKDAAASGDENLGTDRLPSQEHLNNDDKPLASVSKDFERVEALSSSRINNGVGSYSEIMATDEPEDSQIESGDEPKLFATCESLGGFDRVRGNQDNIRSSVGLTFPEDVNHPGNKSNESLLHSLYSVFSKLSGKAVLTAREALSKIIEQRLPGLDEKMGLPSVQVAKVMRSNPYFVHLEGGKFFLCSGPSTALKNQESRIAMETDNQPASLSLNLRQKVAPPTILSKAGNAEQQLVSVTGVRHKRTRSKGTFSEGGTHERTTKKDGVKAVKIQTTTQLKGIDGAEISEPICKRYDGRGWKCNEKALEGYSMCRHHHELIVNRLARLRSSGRLGSKKSVKKRKGNGKQLKEGIISDGDLTVTPDNSGPHWWKNVKARSLKSINT